MFAFGTLDFGVIQRPTAVAAAPARDGPSAVTWTGEAGVNDGEVDISVTDLPADWGDAVVQGDGLGTLGRLRWWNSVDGWATLVDPADTGDFTVTLPPDLWGVETEIRIAGVNDEGVPGTASSNDITPPGDQQEVDTLVIDLDEDAVADDIVTNAADGEQMTVYIPAD